MQNGLLKYRNCLSTVRTPDNIARRRYDFGDPDSYMYDVRSPYSLDADKIMLSKAFRRLADKTQVVTDPGNIHIRNRLSHTMEVVTVAVTIAEILGLNVDLCRAIALGHDIGHTPFGHAGESFINKVTGQKIRHEVLGVLVAQHIERIQHKHARFNLTHQVLTGIRYHSRGKGELKSTNLFAEADAVMIADKIAYIFADINDVIRNGFDFQTQPELNKLIHYFGETQRERVRTCVQTVVEESCQLNRVSFIKHDTARIFAELKQNMYTVYESVNADWLMEKLHKVFDYLQDLSQVEDFDPVLVLALMTDSDVIYLADQEELTDTEQMQSCSVYELLPALSGLELDLTDADLNW